MVKRVSRARGGQGRRGGVERENYWDARERQGGSIRKRETEAERKGEKEMQRLPYNGAPRAHKLRHNVISSSLFNERWQRGARTFYHDVFAVLARSPHRIYLSFSFSLSLSLSLSALFVSPTSTGTPPSPTTTVTIVRPENLLRAMRCVVKSVFET